MVTFFAICDNVFAKDEIFTCNYEMNWFGNNETPGKISIIVYSDETIDVKDIDGTYWKKDKLYNFKIANSSVEMEATSILYKYFYKQAVTLNDGKYSCPDLNVTFKDTWYVLELAEGKAGDVSSSWNFKGSAPVTKNNDDDVIMETSSCTLKHYSSDGGEPGYSYDLVLKMYSDGKKEACFLPKITDDKTITTICDYYDANDEYGIDIFYNNKRFVIEHNQISNFFSQTPLQKTQNKFSCPSELSVNFGNTTDIYVFNASKNTQNTDSSSKDTPAEKCEVLPEAIKKYIMQALKLIRWGGLVLMIVLGTLDFVKASASDDQDAIKKAGQNFIKRLIAVIILFLLPILVELILFIAGKIGFNFGECYKVSEF